MMMRKYRLSMQHLPVDLFADPEGSFTYEALVAAAGLDPESTPPPLVGALAAPWDGQPEGAAVVLGAEGEDAVAFVLVTEVEQSEVRAA
jgi:hypothetical protein